MRFCNSTSGSQMADLPTLLNVEALAATLLAFLVTLWYPEMRDALHVTIPTHQKDRMPKVEPQVKDLANAHGLSW